MLGFGTEVEVGSSFRTFVVTDSKYIQCTKHAPREFCCTTIFFNNSLLGFEPNIPTQILHRSSTELIPMGSFWSTRFSLCIDFSFKAGLVVAIHVIEYAWTFRWRKLWLESDFTSIVSLPRSRFYKVSWHYRECNRDANSLAFRASSILFPT